MSPPLPRTEAVCHKNQDTDKDGFFEEMHRFEYYEGTDPKINSQVRLWLRVSCVSILYFSCCSATFVYLFCCQCTPFSHWCVAFLNAINMPQFMVT